MSDAHKPAARGSRLIPLASLILLGAGCSALDGSHRSSPNDRREPPPDAAATLGTDPASVEPGRTIGPPSLGVDITSTPGANRPAAMTRPV